jgi:hypothetical protein
MSVKSKDYILNKMDGGVVNKDTVLIEILIDIRDELIEMNYSIRCLKYVNGNGT